MLDNAIPRSRAIVVEKTHKYAELIAGDENFGDRRGFFGNVRRLVANRRPHLKRFSSNQGNTILKKRSE